MSDLKSILLPFYWPFVAIVAFGSIAQASDFHSARTVALGGAGHAGPMLTDALFLNPSFASFLPNTIVTGSVGSPDGRSPTYSVAILDGHGDFAFQAGLAYTRRADVNLVTVGAAKSFVKRMGFGLGGKWVIPTDPSQYFFADSTLSVSGFISDWLQVSAIVDNLVELPAARAQNFYREIVLGTKVNIMGIVMLYADPHWTPTLAATESAGAAWGVEAGVEFPVFKDFFLRGGLFKNANLPQLLTRGDGFGLGGGWLAPRIAIDYGFQRTWSQWRGGGQGFVHQASLSVFF